MKKLSLNFVSQCILGTVFIAMVVCFLIYGKEQERTYNRFIPWDSGWTLTDESGSKDITFPYAQHQDSTSSFSIQKTITSQDIDSIHGRLYVVLYYCDAELSIDGKIFQTYHCDKDFAHKTRGMAYLFFDIPNHLDNNTLIGHTLTIKYIPQIDIGTYRLKTPIYGETADIFFHAFTAKILDTILVLIIILMGIVLLFAALFYKLCQKHFNRILLYLGLFSITCGLYLGGRMEWVRIYLQNPYCNYVLEFFCEIMLAAPMLLLLRDLVYGKSKKILQIFIIINLIHISVQMIMHFLTSVEIREILIPTHLTLLASTIAVLYIIFIRREILTGYQKELSYSIIPLAVFSMMDMLLYYVSISIQTGILLKLGIISFVSMEMFFTLNHSRVSLMEEQKNKIYRELAYTDLATGIFNRNAFERDCSNLEHEKDTYQSIACVTVDLNHLKEINDTLSHNQGDHLIKYMADLLQEQFRDRKVYRTGGDEFVVLLYNTAPASLQHITDSLKKAAAKSMASIHMDLSYSIGMAYYQNAKHSSIHDLIKEADAQMYENKRICHLKEGGQ